MHENYKNIPRILSAGILTHLSNQTSLEKENEFDVLKCIEQEKMQMEIKFHLKIEFFLTFKTNYS